MDGMTGGIDLTHHHTSCKALPPIVGTFCLLYVIVLPFSYQFYAYCKRIKSLFSHLLCKSLRLMSFNSTFSETPPFTLIALPV